MAKCDKEGVISPKREEPHNCPAVRNGEECAGPVNTEHRAEGSLSEEDIDSILTHMHLESFSKLCTWICFDLSKHHHTNLSYDK